MEFLPNVLPCGDQLCALFDEGVRTPGIFVGDVSRHRENVAAPLESATCGDACATIFDGFDNEDSEGDSADDPIADGKILWRGESAHGKLGNQRAAGGEA